MRTVRLSMMLCLLLLGLGGQIAAVGSRHDTRKKRHGKPHRPLLLMITLCVGCSSVDRDSLDTDVDALDAAIDSDVDRPIDSDMDRPIDSDMGSAMDVDVDSDLDSERSCREMSANCVSEFGSLFTRSNGRADGTLVALVEPTDRQCELYNDTHVVLQLSMLGHVQRLVVSVNGVSVHTTTAQLLGPIYSEGWHTDLDLDYVTHLEVHSTDFTHVTMDEAVSFICSELEVGDPVSVFAYSEGDYPASAHQIHRVDHYPDGAIVARPTSDAPTYLLFRYSDQVF